MARLYYIIVVFFVFSAFVNNQIQVDGRSYPVQHSSTKFLTPLLRQFSAIVNDFRPHPNDFATHSDDFTTHVDNIGSVVGKQLSSHGEARQYSAFFIAQPVRNIHAEPLWH